jgi:heptosyltransferase-1
MRVLLVKTSSLGDLIHTFPALTDARTRVADIRFDWLVEESFSDVPRWHPAVDEVIPIATRRWRKGWRKAWRRGELRRFRATLRKTPYDLVLDAQGLIKSALPALLARGPAAGFDRRSAREPLSSLFYRQRFAVDRKQHAIQRTRQLFAAALGYETPESAADYGLHFPDLGDADQRRLVFLHGTTWPTKHWPETYWAELLDLAVQNGYRVELPWGDPDDRLRAERIMKMAGHGELLPRIDLSTLARVLCGSGGVVGVDSGLAHLAAAVGVPAVTLYGPTRTELTGATGKRQRNLAAQFECAPCMRRECAFTGASNVSPACFETLAPRWVWQALCDQMDRTGDAS